MPGRPKLQATLRFIEENGGWEHICDMVADGASVGDVAKYLDCSKRFIYTVKSQREGWDVMWEEAMKIRAETLIEQSIADFDRLDRVVDVDEHGADIHRVPLQSEVSLVQGRAKFRTWLAGKLDPERFADKQGPDVNVNLSIGEMHLAAVKSIKAREALPPAPVPVLEAEVIHEE